jgi:tripartite-type tricarboxylate transporter receptor subunit TctC
MQRVSSALTRAALGALLLAAACGPRATTGGRAPADAAPSAPASGSSAGTAAPAAGASAGTAAPAAQAAGSEQQVASFYRGKTIRIVVGFAPGGGFDTYGRLIAKYLSKYVPGRPTVIVENVPGAASMVAANQVYKTLPKDGTVIASFNENLVLLSALGKEGIEYDPRRFQWLASMVNSPSACATRADAGVNSFEEVMAGKQWIIASEGPGTTTYDVPVALQAALGANLKLVPGYDGTSRMRLAIESREADGGCWTWDSMSVTARQWFESSPPFAKVLVVMGNRTPDHPWLQGVPAAENLATTPENRQLLALVNVPAQMSKPYAVAPEVPHERAEALRQAFAAVAADAEFIAEAEKAKLDVVPLTGAEVEERVRVVLDAPPAVLAKLKEVLK